MSLPSCGACHVGMCKKHPLQDHGRRAAELKAKAGGADALQRIYERLVAPTVKNLDAAAQASSQVTEEYKKVCVYLLWLVINVNKYIISTDLTHDPSTHPRQQSALDREKASKRKRKRMTAEQQEAVSALALARAPASGLGH